MDEHSRKARIAELQARMDKEKALLRKDTRAADNKRKYLLGGLVVAGLEESQQLRRWVLKAITDNPPRDNANQKAILPLLETIAAQEGMSVPNLPEPVRRKQKTNSFLKLILLFLMTTVSCCSWMSDHPCTITEV